MSFNDTVTMTWQEDGGSPILATVSLSDSQSDKLDLVVAGGSYADAAFPLTLSKLSMLFLYSNADVTIQSGGTDETQTVTPGGTVGGTDTLILGFGGQSAPATTISTTTAAQLQGLLELLSTIGTGNVAVTGATGGPWTVRFTGALGNTNVAQMTALVGTTTGATVTIATTANGAAATESIALLGGLPSVWYVGMPQGKPFASNVASLRALNGSSQQATVRVRALRHP